MLHINSKFIYFKSQRGVSLLLVSLIMSVILSISFGVSSILTKQIKTTQEIGYSVIVFYAADSGVEKALYDLYKLPIPHQSNQLGNCGEADFEVQLKCGASVLAGDCPANLATSSSCNALNICIKSLGTYQKTRRAIEIKY